MKNIALRHCDYVVKVDDDDAPSLSGHKWRLMRREYKGKEWAYAVTEIDGKATLMHRLIAGAGKGQFVDHIDGDTLNNQSSNLRLCSHADNMKNRVGSRFSASGIRGVHKYGDKWRAQVESDGQVFRLGVFVDPQDARRAVESAVISLHGQFARVASKTEFTG